MRYLAPGLAMVLFLPWIPGARAEPGTAPNLLRNGDFQDDWITLLPENKNHHWCYSAEFFNRRDFNPDTWICRGSWQWADIGAPAGRRRLILRGPAAQLTQRVNWVAVHDDRSLSGFPDAGGFPDLKPQRSSRPLGVVRDLTLRVRINGEDVPAGAGAIEVGFCPPGMMSASDPMGSVVPPVATASVPVPSGTFEHRWVEVKLTAAAWLEAVHKTPQGPEDARLGPVLPGTAQVTIRYAGARGSIEVERAELVAAEPDAPNLLRNGGFETAQAGGYPEAWSAPVKYRYFPPRLYYLMNTWHNGNSDNRGPVAADSLIALTGVRSLKMIVAAGDEKAVESDSIILNQTEPRLIEVHAWVKTDCLCRLQIDAVDEQGQRLDGFNFIHKAPVSIGTEDWRVIRQVFRPRAAVRSIRLQLCARGSNAYTLDDTGQQPQNNVVGTIWWDDVRLTEPESTAAELAARGVPNAPAAETTPPARPGPRLAGLDLGERLLGANELGATIINPGPARTFVLQWEFTGPAGTTRRFASAPQRVAEGGQETIRLPYELAESLPAPYTEFRATLALLERDPAGDRVLAASTLWFGGWTTPIDLELGALYLRPEQHQGVRMNLGLAAATVATLAKLRLEVVRRGTGEVLKHWEIVDPARRIAEMRSMIPADLREDFLNLLLARLDVSFLPVQPFNNPERNWLVRVLAWDAAGHEVARVQSAPFCRQAHDPSAQPAITSVAVRGDRLLVNGRTWMPWGAAYGFIPVYAGSEGAGPLVFRDLHNLPEWSIYDGFTPAPYDRRGNDLNCLRYVAASITNPAVVEQHWHDDNLYASSVFVTPQPALSLEDVVTQSGGRSKLEAYAAFCRKAPMVVSVAPGIEEVFGLFQGATPTQLRGLEQVVAELRRETGKPVMVSHGGGWNRFEFEKVPYFDIYDPETEPLYPANLHTDLKPLIEGRDKVIWLRPQMYEDVPYERWRFHVYVELMRGCRGWQIAHGPGDQSLFRGLHGEVAFLKPILESTDPGPAVTITPAMEHWSRRHNNKLYLIAATTRGLPFGAWRSVRERDRGGPAGDISRLTGDEGGRSVSPFVHGVQYLPAARRWPTGTRLVQWVWLDPKAPPKLLVVLVKADGRWTHAAAWGDTQALALRQDPDLAHWFLTTFYRQATGFLGWDRALVPTALGYIPDRIQGRVQTLPGLGQWTRLEIALEMIGASNALLDGVGFLHQEGRVYWGHTALTGTGLRRNEGESTIWGDSLAIAPGRLAHTRLDVAGLKKGTRVRVLFEDRELTSDEGGFRDDFRGQDLYQRYGGECAGYGSDPVATHIYEIPAP
jgi:hypothetical protein